MKNKPVSEVINSSLGNWPAILQSCGIEIPAGGKHGACPTCGGKDRFRFDDRDGRGTWFCNQCGSGDGLDLVANALKLSLGDAAKHISGGLRDGDRAAQPQPARKEASTYEKPTGNIGDRVATLIATQTTPGDAPYLVNRGLTASAANVSAEKSCALRCDAVSGRNV